MAQRENLYRRHRESNDRAKMEMGGTYGEIKRQQMDSRNNKLGPQFPRHIKRKVGIPYTSWDKEMKECCGGALWKRVLVTKWCM